MLPQLVWRIWKKLRNAGRALAPESPEEDFHRVRILAKRARYSAETVAVYMPSKQKRQLEDFAERAEAVQNILGEHHDAAFARDVVRGIAAEHPDDPRISSRVGTLVEREKAIAEERRNQFFDKWRKQDRKKHTKWGK